MKKFSILLSVIIIAILCFAELMHIAEQNEYTSVRKYSKPKTDTTQPSVYPIIEQK